MQSNSCIVCAGAATVYCHNDDAYLCYACDDHVHSANPLAQRHHRVPIADAAADGSIDNMIDSLVPSVFEMPMRSAVQDQSVKPDGQAVVTPAREASLPFDDDDFFAVPDALAVSRDQSLPFSPQTLLGKGFLSDDIDIFDIDPMLLDRLDCGYDKISCDLLDCLVPEAPAKQETRAVFKQPTEQEPARASQKAAERPQRAAAVQPQPQQQQPVLSPMTYMTAPAMSAPQHSTMTFATEAGDCTVDVSTYIPRSLLPMDPAAKMQLLAERRVRVERFREKKKNRQFKKTIRYASRKAYAEVRPRIKGRFARKDEVAAMREAGLLPALA